MIHIVNSISKDNLRVNHHSIHPFACLCEPLRQWDFLFLGHIWVVVLGLVGILVAVLDFAGLVHVVPLFSFEVVEDGFWPLGVFLLVLLLV